METPAAPCAGAREGNPISELQLGSCVGGARGLTRRAQRHLSNTPSVSQKQDFNRHEQREHLLDLLKAVAPEAFCIPPVPLAVGIRRQLLDLVEDEFTWNDVSAVLRRWVGRYDYVAAIATGGQRFNLDGTTAGEVLPQHQQFALAQLAACTALKPKATEK